MDFVKLTKQWRENGIYPYFPIIKGPSDRKVLVEHVGEAYMLASCDYLGLSNDTRLKEAAIAGINRFGTNICGSLIFSGMTEIHRDLQQRLASFMGTDAAIIFPTSYLANLGCLLSIAGSDDILVFDSQNHVSLFHGAALSKSALRTFPHANMDKLEGILRRARKYRRRYIVTDGLFSADGDYADLRTMADLADRYDANLIVDSAHDLATYGPRGRGLVEACGLLDKVDLIVGTMSKAFGSTGGFIVGREDLITQICHAAGPFHSSRAVSPGVAAASIRAIDVVESEGAERRARLHHNASRLGDGLRTMGFDTMNSCSPVIPILLKEVLLTLRATTYLQEHGVIVCAMIPPSTPAGSARLRLNVTCLLNDWDIDQILEIFQGLKNRIGEWQ